MESMGFEISWDKYDINDKCVSYCQEFGLMPKYNKLFHFVEDKYKKQFSLFVDIPKMRLLNQFQKTGDRQVFDQPDPLLGKAQAMSKQMGFFDEFRTQVMHPVSAEVHRYLLRLENFSNQVVVALRLLMPSWMEWKVCKDCLTYMPTKLNGLGLRCTWYKWEDDPKAVELARRIYTLQSKPFDLENQSTWERGVWSQLTYLNKAIQEGLAGEPRTFKDIEAELKDLLGLDDSSTIGRRKIYNTIDDTYFNVSKPIPLVNSKENVYVTLAIEPGKTIERTTLSRTRTKFSILRKRTVKLEPTLLSTDRLASGGRPEGMYLEKQRVKSLLSTGFIAPSLHLANWKLTGGRKSSVWVNNIEQVRDSEIASSISINTDEGMSTQSLVHE